MFEESEEKRCFNECVEFIEKRWAVLLIGLITFTMVAGTVCSIIEYRGIKKYYPNLTFWEYVLLHDKIRITPTGD